MKRLSFLTVSLMVLSCFAGCQYWKPEPEPQIVLPILDVTADPNIVVVRTDFQAKSINAAGGLQSWMNVTKIERDCVVTFYKPDGTFYITEQKHVVYPWSNSLQVYSKEPKGNFAWQYYNGQFKSLEGCSWNDCLPVDLDPNSFAKALLDITTAPARFFDSLSAFSNETRATRLEGQIYIAISQICIQTGSEVRGFFYQNNDSSIIDMTAFSPVNADVSIAARGYNYSRTGASGILLPYKIEIFKSGINSIFEKRIVKIEYKSR